MKNRTIVMLGVLVVLPLLASPAAADADEDGIKAAVLDYVNSAYLVKPELVEKSVHPKLQKVGYVRGEDGSYSERWMTREQLAELVAGWNKEGRFDPATARKDVTILDRLDRIAVARLDAEWGIDFFHLAKIDGKWMIVNVIWQTYPPEP